MNPGLEAVQIPELREPAPGEHERVLQNVLGETRVAQDPVGNGVQRIADLMHQDCERLSVAFPSPLDEVSIHLDLRVAAVNALRLPTMTGARRENVQIMSRGPRGFSARRRWGPAARRAAAPTGKNETVAAAAAWHVDKLH